MTRREIESAALRWLIGRGVWLPERPYAENLARCAKFRAWCAGRLGSPPGVEWARALVDDYRAGVVLPAYSVKLALAALGLPEEQILRPPAKQVPRPDAKELAAGDVEVAF